MGKGNVFYVTLCNKQFQLFAGDSSLKAGNYPEVRWFNSNCLWVGKFKFVPICFNDIEFVYTFCSSSVNNRLLRPPVYSFGFDNRSSPFIFQPEFELA